MTIAEKLAHDAHETSILEARVNLDADPIDQAIFEMKHDEMLKEMAKV